MADWENSLKNGVITFLGGLIEPTSEVAKPIPPAETVVLNAGEGTTGVNNDGSPLVPKTTQQDKTLLYAGLGIAALLVIILLVVAFKD